MVQSVKLKRQVTTEKGRKFFSKKPLSLHLTSDSLLQGDAANGCRYSNNHITGMDIAKTFMQFIAMPGYESYKCRGFWKESWLKKRRSGFRQPPSPRRAKLFQNPRLRKCRL
ncbi:hypothetical protein ACLOJK_038184 [Asimina triloba]